MRLTSFKWNPSLSKDASVFEEAGALDLRCQPTFCIGYDRVAYRQECDSWTLVVHK
jgi:hypothetical protein